MEDKIKEIKDLVIELPLNNEDNKLLQTDIDEYLKFIMETNKSSTKIHSIIPNTRNCVHNLHKKKLHDKIINRYKLYEPDLTTFLGRLDNLIASILVYVPS